MVINNGTPVEELRMLGEEFRNKFSIHHLQELAYQTGMIQRKRKFQVQNLVSLYVFLGQTISSESLVSLCTKLNEATGTCISAEALNKRWNEKTVTFSKRVISICLPAKNLSHTIASQSFCTNSHFGFNIFSAYFFLCRSF